MQRNPRNDSHFFWHTQGTMLALTIRLPNEKSLWKLTCYGLH